MSGQHQIKLLKILEELMTKLKPFLPILISGAVFIVFSLLPASWFTGLSK